jgi:hypothetical protein
VLTESIYQQGERIIYMYTNTFSWGEMEQTSLTISTSRRSHIYTKWSLAVSASICRELYLFRGVAFDILLLVVLSLCLFLEGLVMFLRYQLFWLLLWFLAIGVEPLFLWYIEPLSMYFGTKVFSFQMALFWVLFSF